jgi:hypothetical protein
VGVGIGSHPRYYRGINPGTEVLKPSSLSPWWDHVRALDVRPAQGFDRDLAPFTRVRASRSDLTSAPSLGARGVRRSSAPLQLCCGATRPLGCSIHEYERAREGLGKKRISGPPWQAIRVARNRRRQTGSSIWPRAYRFDKHLPAGNGAGGKTSSRVNRSHLVFFSRNVGPYETGFTRFSRWRRLDDTQLHQPSGHRRLDRQHVELCDLPGKLKGLRGQGQGLQVGVHAGQP